MNTKRHDQTPQLEPVRCPDCGSADPGFLDSDHPNQVVRCPNATCHASAPWREWQLVGRLAEGIVEASDDRGRYTLGHTSAAVSIFFEPTDGARIELGAVDTSKAVAYLPRIGDGRHAGLVDLLESLNITIEHEGYLQ